MKKFYTLKSWMLMLLAAGFIMAGCSDSKEDEGPEVPIVDNRDDVIGTYPVKVTVGGLADLVLYTNLDLAKEGDDNLKASASVSVPEMGDLNINLTLSSLEEYTPETRALPTGYYFKIAEQYLDAFGTPMPFSGAGTGDFDGKVYKTAAESFISFEIAGAAGAVTVKVESGTDPGQPGEDALVFDGFAGEFWGDTFDTGSSYLQLWFYNGDINPVTGPTGAYELLWVEAFNTLVDFADFTGLQEGTYNPSTEYEGHPLHYIMGDPTDDNGNLMDEPWMGTFYRKVDENNNIVAAYFFTSGTFTVNGNTMTAKLSGFELDETKSDGRGDDVTDMEFTFEGSMGSEKFIDNSPPSPPDEYQFAAYLFGGYYGDFEVDGSGKFVLSFDNDRSTMDGRIGVSLTGFINPQTFEEGGWIYLEPGTYNVSDSNSPMTLVPGEVDVQSHSAKGTYFYKLTHDGSGLESALAIDGGSITITDMEQVNEETGKKVFRIDFNLTSTGTAAGIENIDQYYYEGPLWCNNTLPTTTYSVPAIGSVQLQFNGNYGANSAGFGMLNFSGTAHPETGNPQYFSMKVGIYFDNQPTNDIVLTPGNYSFDTTRESMTITPGSYSGSTVNSSGAYLIEYNGMGTETLNWIAIEGGTVNVVHNGDDNYTITFNGVYGKDVQTWHPKTNITFTYTGDLDIMVF